ncbi:hypothetical protein BGX31_003157 [Mortierella sp. GBA43]|nr:hypothetical protein BGX31_003157 [Mortierella sp. GBA43]
MLFKTASLAVLASVAATVAAQTPGTPNHTFFTSPVGDGITYEGGQKTVFSWQRVCVSGDSTSTTPTATEVHLVNSNNPNGAFFVANVTTIDCTKDQGNTQWTVPPEKADGVTNYALKIILSPTAAYSGNFKIMPAGGSTGGSNPAPSTGSGGSTGGSTGGKSAASSLAPVFSGVALAVSAAAAMFF